MDVDRKLSIIIPVYNTKPYLETCLQSVIGQTYRNLEILIIDDGSTDGSDMVCKAFAEKDQRILYIRQENKGLIGARRTGVEHASGKFLMFVDSDDWIDEGMAAFLAEQIQDADLVSTGVHYETKPDIVTEYLDQYDEGEYHGADKAFLLKTMLYDKESDVLQRLTPWIWNKLYRTEMAGQVYRKIDTDNAFAEDGVFLYHYLILSGAVQISHKCFYHYRYRTGSMFHGGNPNMLSDINKAYLALQPDFARHPFHEDLLSQLQCWVTVTAVMAVNGGMGFSPQCQIPEFILDTDGLKGKKIVLYGAGKAGKDYFRQLTKMGYEVVLWVDGNNQQTEGIHSPTEISKTKYDLILVAVSRQEYADSMIRVLLDMGIDQKQIVWKKPVRTF